MSKTLDLLVETLSNPPICQILEEKDIELDLLFREEREFGSRMKEFQFSSRHGHIESFLDEIDRCMSVVPQHDILNTSLGYQFPSDSTVGKYHQLFDLGEDKHFVNETEYSIHRAITRVVDDLLDESAIPANIAITGKVGSGKSTFLTYFLKALSRYCKEKNVSVVYSLISYEDVKSKFRESLTKEDWRKLFDQRVLDQTVYYGFLTVYSKQRFADHLKTWVEARNQVGSLDQDALKSITRLCRSIKNGHINTIWDKAFLSKSISNSAKHLLLEFMVRNYCLRVLVVFDGFDAFSLDKIINKNNKAIVPGLTQKRL